MKALWDWFKSLFSRVEPAPLPPKKTAGDLVRPIQEQIGQVEPHWMAIARAELGTKEKSGSADHPRIVEYHLSTNLDKAYAANDETPWCSSFVNWCMEKAGERGTNSAGARSWLKWGLPMDKPKRGCVVVFSRGSNAGHVAFFIKEVGSNILCLGGNQNNAVCEALYPKERVLGYRWKK
jgi:uncharacterized protein (TIGR02594 family)